MLRYKLVFIISVCSFVVTIIFGFAAYGAIFEYAVRNQVTLHKKNYVRQFYLKYPIALDFRAYFFNVTNPDDVLKGNIPILKEIGPYCYDLYKERVNVEDDETEDTLTYNPNDTYFFNQERSGNLTQDDYVTVLHPLVTGMVMHVATKTPQFLSILAEALPHLFDPKTLYLTDKVRNILFDGMLINCTSKQFAAMAVCTQLKMKMPGITIDGSYLKFGLMTQKNGTIPTRVKVLRGIRKSEELGTVVAVDNHTRNDIWSVEECNEFRGTDGWIYPPFSGNADQIWIHPTDLCMNLHADFVGQEVNNGFRVRKFFADYTDECTNCTQNTCLPKGLLDLTQCIKVPVYVSLPHFLRSDEVLFEKVRGLSPDEDKHITRIFLEETLSLPVEAQIRIQFNFPLKPIDKVPFMANLTELIHPLMWVEVGVVLNGWFLHMIQAFFYFLTAVEVGKYLMLLLSVAGIAYAAYLYLNNKKLYSMKDTIALK